MVWKHKLERLFRAEIHVRARLCVSLQKKVTHTTELANMTKLKEIP